MKVIKIFIVLIFIIASCSLNNYTSISVSCHINDEIIAEYLCKENIQNVHQNLQRTHNPRKAKNDSSIKSFQRSFRMFQAPPKHLPVDSALRCQGPGQRGIFFLMTAGSLLLQAGFL